MCGIVGIYTKNRQVDPYSVIRMLDTIRHRGPDENGIYFNPDKRGCLGHARLSIIDLSQAGHQPVCNEDGYVWITYNGEIYNYQELRKELLTLGHTFKSQTDTEFIIHGYEEWGTEGVLNRLRGMFAFCILDLRPIPSCPQLFIYRDRVGMKPIYYSYFDHTFIFASELKAIISSDIILKEIEPNSIGLYLLHGLIPHLYTVYKKIFSLEPGHFLILVEKGIRKKRCYNLTNAFLDTSLSSNFRERVYRNGSLLLY